MESKIYHIYLLKLNGVVIYVGVSVNPKVRLLDHKRSIGDNIEMEIADTFSDRKLAYAKEKELIAFYKNKGLAEFNGNNINGNVRVSKKIVNRVRAYCKPKGIKIAGFFELAAMEKLKDFKPNKI